jgi:hypothetical protein
MCANCDTHIINEAFILLETLFEQHGKDTVIDVIHDYYHNKGK